MLGSLRAQVRDLGIESAVAFTGMLEGEARIEAFQAADLFVLPSVGEGASMALLEAMASGLPVVLTEGADLPEIESTGAGIVVPPTAEALAEAIRSLGADPHRRAAMGERGRELVRSRHTWPRVAGEVLSVYEAVLARAARTTDRMAV
jgi:glycosyltransferase involved in cell wall biosynthesis